MSVTSTRILAAVALVITFLVGGLVGLVADRYFMLRRGGPVPSASFIVKRLDRRLHFTDQQRTQVTQIIERRQQRIAVIWTNVRPSVHREIEETNAEIDRLLTPEQRTEFAKIRARLMPRRSDRGMRVGRGD